MMAALTSVEPDARLTTKSNVMQQMKKGSESGSVLQEDVIETVGSLYQKVEDLALAAVLNTPTPLMISFSLLSYEECDAAFEAMCEQWAVASAEQDTFLYLMTEAVVLSFSNPSDVCGMFGNNFHVNSHGYYKFKKIALKLQDQWRMTFRTYLNVCFGESKMLKAKKCVESMNSLLKLLTDLDCRTCNKVKAINLAHLCKVAEDYLDEMQERIKLMISERMKSRKSAPPSLKISATKQTENRATSMKPTAALSSGKKTGSLPLSPINRNFSKNEIVPRVVASKIPDGPTSIKKIASSVKIRKTIQSKISFPKLSAKQTNFVSLDPAAKKRPFELTKKSPCTCKNCVATSLSLTKKNSEAAKKAKMEIVLVESGSSDSYSSDFSSPYYPFDSDSGRAAPFSFSDESLLTSSSDESLLTSSSDD